MNTNIGLLILGFGLGSVLGSFIKVLSDRSLTNRSFRGRSYCESCKKRLKWYDLFPIFSYLLLKGKCRYCKKKLSLEYPLTELIMGLLIAGVFFQNFSGNFYSLSQPLQIIKIATALFQTFAISVLLTVFVTDLKEYLIPDRITFPAIKITLVYLLILSINKIYILYQETSQSLIGKYLLPPYSDYFYRHAFLDTPELWTGIVAAVLMIIFFGGLILITKGRGMGGGDLKLGIFMGLALGLPNTIVALVLAFLIGSVVGVGLLIVGKKKLKQVIPFGPFLSVGSVIALFWGNQIMDWYLKLKT